MTEINKFLSALAPSFVLLEYGSFTVPHTGTEERRDWQPANVRHMPMGGGRTRSFLLSQQFSTHTLCMAFLAGLFLGLCLLLFADTAATQSLGEVLPIK